MKRVSKAKLNQGINNGNQRKENPYTLKRIRAQLAKIPRPKVRPKAVAAFLFLPQFRSSFAGLAHLYPVFVRMVAVLFAECTLIPPNHPALVYKSTDEKTNYSFKRLVGDAWFTLKTTKATTYQWSMFGAVTMMIVTLVAALGAFFGRIMLGVGSVAQAQIFDIFQAPSNPYTGGATGPDVSSINTGTAAIGAVPGGMLFDSRIQNNGISTDYAIMVLDKVLRQSMADVPNGGAMQNALRDLMMIYNSGMLVVACIMIGWMVISLIIDTAKTGTVGGGRHNMVWLPIRVLFALAIMFPLGSVGYSGGQYMVVKLAEWGSNFGSRGWATYVATVVGNQQLLAPYSVKNASNLVNGIAKVMVCQVAYNTYVRQRTGALDPSQIITRYRDDPGTAALGGATMLTNRYTNTGNTNVCGIIKYGSNLIADDDQQRQMNRTLAAGNSTVRMSSSDQRNSAPDNVYTNAALQTATKAYHTAMRAAVETQIEEVLAGDANGAPRVGPSITAARNFACQFVARRFGTGDVAVTANPVADIAPVVPECAGVTAAASDPPITFLTTMHTNIQAAQMAAFTGGGRGALDNYILGNSTTSPMLVEMLKRGWAGMGMWYQDIINLNNVMLSVQAPYATVEPGGAWVGTVGSGWEDQCAGGSNKNPQGEPCKFPGIAEKVMEVMSEYDRWWGVSSMVTDAGKPAVPGAAQSNEEVGRGGSDTFSSVLSSIGSMTYGNNGIINIFLRVLFPRMTNTFIFKSIDLEAANIYPLTQLADTGHTILGLGLAMWTGISIFQTVSTIDGAGFSLGKGLAFSALMQVLAGLGSVMILTGILMTFYLPALPFIRVAFAVLTWITSVFEAVVMVPVAALTHLSTTGPGLLGQHGRVAWVMWFNIFLRPILVVFGFIAGMLIFNAFAVYFHTTFTQGADIIMSGSAWYTPAAYISKICYSVVYLATLYSVANTTFKLMDFLPSHMMRWMGEWGSRIDGPVNMDPGPLGRGTGFAAAQLMDELKVAVPGEYIKAFRNNNIDYLGERVPNVLSRAENMAADASTLTKEALKQRESDRLLALSRMSGKEREEYQRQGSQFNKDRFLLHKFMAQEENRYHRFSWEKGMGSGLLARLSAGRGAYVDGGKFFRDDYRAIKDGVVGRGNLAGVSVSDKMVDEALEMGNTSRTNNWDELSATERDIVQKKVLSRMSMADMVMYNKMGAESQMDFVQSVFLTDPEAYAPGVGKAGVDKMTEFLKFSDKLKEGDNAALAAMLMRKMTRSEKDQATRRYLAWEKENGRVSNPSMLLGQLGGMSVSDRMLDRALSIGSQLAGHTAEHLRSHRLVTTALKKYKYLTDGRELFTPTIIPPGSAGGSGPDDPDPRKPSPGSFGGVGNNNLKALAELGADGSRVQTVPPESPASMEANIKYALDNFTPDEKENFEKLPSSDQQQVADMKALEAQVLKLMETGAISPAEYARRIGVIRGAIAKFIKG